MTEKSITPTVVGINLLKATIKFLKKFKTISNHVGSLTKKEINEIIKDYKKYYKNRLDEIKKILET